MSDGVGPGPSGLHEGSLPGTTQRSPPQQQKLHSLPGAGAQGWASSPAGPGGTSREAMALSSWAWCPGRGDSAWRQFFVRQVCGFPATTLTSYHGLSAFRQIPEGEGLLRLRRPHRAVPGGGAAVLPRAPAPLGFQSPHPRSPPPPSEPGAHNSLLPCPHVRATGWPQARLVIKRLF